MGVDVVMFARTRAHVTRDMVSRWEKEMIAAFGREAFRTLPAEGPWKRRGPIDLVGVCQWNGPDFLPEPGETFLEVYPESHFYGKDYPRGDAPFLIVLAGWLEARVPGGKVWYGGDSQFKAAPFTPARRRRLLDHYYATIIG